MVHQNKRLSSVAIPDILDADHPPIVFHIQDHDKTKTLFEPVEKLADWKRFHSLAYDLISPRIEINSEQEAVKTFVPSAYRLSTSKVTLSNTHALSGLGYLLKPNKRLQKLWKETRDPACKTAVR
jgi:hypothetical protein